MAPRSLLRPSRSGVVVLAAGSFVDQADLQACRADARVLVTAAESGRIAGGTWLDEDQLVEAGLLDAPSSLNDIVVDADGYSIVGPARAAGPTTRWCRSLRGQR